jgi:hypothetical protein
MRRRIGKLWIVRNPETGDNYRSSTQAEAEAFRDANPGFTHVYYGDPWAPPLTDEECQKIIAADRLDAALDACQDESFLRATLMGQLIEYCKRSQDDGLFVPRSARGLPESYKYCLCRNHRQNREASGTQYPDI